MDRRGGGGEGRWMAYQGQGAPGAGGWACSTSAFKSRVLGRGGAHLGQEGVEPQDELGVPRKQGLDLLDDALGVNPARPGGRERRVGARCLGARASRRRGAGRALRCRAPSPPRALPVQQGGVAAAAGATSRGQGPAATARGVAAPPPTVGTQTQSTPNSRLGLKLLHDLQKAVGGDRQGGRQGGSVSEAPERRGVARRGGVGGGAPPPPPLPPPPPACPPPPAFPPHLS